MKAYARECWREEVAAMQTPDDWARQTREHPGCEQSGERSTRSIRALLTNLMNGAKRQTTSRQPAINGIYPEA
jgi:hypothetical protein